MAELSVGLDLRAWIEANTTFPNTMVDRITPATEDVHREVLKQVRVVSKCVCVLVWMGETGFCWVLVLI